MSVTNKILTPKYLRRIERGLAKGLTRQQARGHAPPRKRLRKSAKGSIDPSSAAERGLKLVKEGVPLKQAAKAVGKAPETLRRYIGENTAVAIKGRRLVIKDRRPRRFPIYSDGKLKDPILRPREATKASAYMRAVDKFLSSGDRRFLEDFESKGLKDINGAFVPFETDPETLYQLDAAGELSFPEIYKIIR